MPDRSVPEGLDALADTILAAFTRVTIAPDGHPYIAVGGPCEEAEAALKDLLARCEKAERDASFYKTERDLYDGRCCEAERERDEALMWSRAESNLSDDTFARWQAAEARADRLEKAIQHVIDASPGTPPSVKGYLRAALAPQDKEGT